MLSTDLCLLITGAAVPVLGGLLGKLYQRRLAQALEQRNSELEASVQQRTLELQQLAEQQNALAEVIRKIRSSLDIETIFQLAATEVRQLLNADRVGVFCFYPNTGYDDGEFVSESVVAPYDSALKIRVHDHCFGDRFAAHYYEGKIQAVADIHNAGLSQCHIDVLSRFQIRANLIVPILKGESLWGLLCIHQCVAPREWQGTEIEFVSQIATQLGVALQQADLLERSRQQALELATINSNLEQEIIVRRQAEQRLSLFIQQTPLAVIEWDTNFRVTRWNSAAYQMFGYTATEAMGRHPAQLVLPEEVWESVDQNFTTLLTRHEGSHSTTENLTKDGRLIVCEWYNTPLIDAGEVIGIASLVLDITERVQAEAQLRQKTEQLQNTLQELQQTQTHLIQSEKMSSLGQLVAGVAHEINNPVNFIYGNIAHVAEYTQDLFSLLELYQHHYPQAIAEIDAKIEDADLEFIGEDLPKLLTSMRVGAERIREIVLSLRNFSRLDQAEVKPVDIHEGLESTLMILQHRLKPTASRPGIEVMKEFGDLPKVECFAGQLNQVFMNLLANAIDALQEYQDLHGKEMPNQQPARITISTRALNAETVQIRVRDNGPGIPEDVRDRLFDPFFTTKPSGKGTGLGLSISYQIVEKHQGTLQCVPSADGGAEFVIEIPVKQAIAAQADSLLLNSPSP